MLNFGKNHMMGTCFPVKDVKIYIIEDGGKARKIKTFYKTKDDSEVKPLPEDIQKREELLLNMRKKLGEKYGSSATLREFEKIHIYIPVEELKEEGNLIVVSFEDKEGDKGYLSEWVKRNPETEIKGFLDVCKIRPVGYIGKSKELLKNGFSDF